MQQHFDRVYDITRQIPAGQVASYGQVAFVAELGSARIVGRAMASLSAGTDVPWHRVINSQGRIAIRKDGKEDSSQRRLLTAEGVFFDATGRIDFASVAWTGPSWAWLAENGYDVEALVMRSQNLRRTGPWQRWHF